MSEDCGQAAPAPARPLESPGPGQSSEVRGPAHTDTQHSPTSPQPDPVVTTLSPVTSSRSLSPLTRHKARGRVPGFPQRVTQASASVNNVSESGERRTRGHYAGPVDTESSVTTPSVLSPPSPANNLSRGLLGRLLFTESERGHIYSKNTFMFIPSFSCNKNPLIDVA